MLDALLFSAILGLIILMLTPVWVKYQWDPAALFVVIAVLLVPGFYAALTGGPYVSSTKQRRDTMLKLAKIRKGEVVYDLGCGDGRLVRAAANRGARAIGYELSVPLVVWGWLNTLLGAQGQIRLGNLWKQELKDADVVFCYLLPKSMERFFRDIWPTLKKGTRVVSNGFPIHALKPKRTAEGVFLYVV